MRVDLAIVGGGPGGYTAGLRAAQLGMSVVLVESAQLGGLCLNRGCIPTKAMLQTATLARHFRQAAKFGLVVDCPLRIDFQAALERRDAVVRRLRNGTQSLLKRANVAVLAGRASVVGPHAVHIEPVPAGVGAIAGAQPAAEQVIEAESILLATGSKPLTIPVPGVEHPRVLDSDTAFALRELPASLVIVGAGPLGCEWGQIFARLGTKVTVLEMLPAVLPRVDSDLSSELAKVLRRDGVAVHTGVSVNAIYDAGPHLEVEFAQVDGETQTVPAEHVLLAAGRGPNTDGLGLETLGVKTGEKGWIETDEFQRTNVPSILAAGDVTGVALLAHVAVRQGVIAVEKLAGLSPEPVRPDRIPSATHTDPEVATVGLTEAEARASDPDVLVGRFPLSANGRAVAQGEDHGLVKLVAESGTGRVLGVHMVGPHVGEMLGEAVLALESQATVDQLGALIRSHPTVTEAIGEAALAARGLALSM